MPAQITQLIDKRDNFEILRDEIAALLAVESAQQQLLASAAARDPADWELSVFVERAHPWAEFIDSPAVSPPLVNVSYDNQNFDRGASNAVERQKSTAVYHLDCYGYGITASDGGAGHVPGDRQAAEEAQRAVRLVRNILMAGVYTYLGLRGTVWRRWVQSITMFNPPIEERTVQQVVAARIALEVDFNEFAPQVAGDELDLVSATVTRSDNGQILINADYQYGVP